jgi:hypothetical protein
MIRCPVLSKEIFLLILRIRLSKKRLEACMDVNNLSIVAVEASTLKVLNPRDAAYDEVVKNDFQELTRRKYSFSVHFSKESSSLSFE